MKIFIDLGAYDGDTLAQAMDLFSDCDRFYAFEPFVDSFNALVKKFGGDDKVILICKGASSKDGEASLFIKQTSNEGHSMCATKTNVSKESINITSIDFSQFIFDNFDKTDEIILKVNIEGAEYDMFNKMIEDNSISYIDKIFCEWHFHKIPNIKKEHNRIVDKLRKRGFNLTGLNSDDAFVIYVNNHEDEYGHK